MNEEIVNITGLEKSFDGEKVIENISFSLFSGENLVLLGKSGSGKSVIMKCIVRLIEADKGNIDVFGTDIINCSGTELAQVRSQIGYLFQNGALYDSMSIQENLLFPVMRNELMKKLPKAQLNKLVEENLENVGLPGVKDKMPSELSGGMRKRAGLARTLMLSPRFIIYDEPTTGLDPFTTEAISKLILAVQKEYNTASIIITHDIKCAEITADRLLVLHQGHLLTEGTFEDLKNNKDPEVQLFFK